MLPLCGVAPARVRLPPALPPPRPLTRNPDPRPLAGQKHIRPYWKNYYQNTDAIVYMVDSADRRRTDEAADELGQLLEEELLAGTPVLVYANKQDLLNAMSAAEVGRPTGADRH